MPRMVFSTECDDQQRVIHKRNVVCSANLLRSLRCNHSVWVEKFDPEPVAAPEPTPAAEPINALDPIVPELVTPVIFATNKIEQIKRIVCRRFQVSRDNIESNSRKKGVVLPRQIGMYLARKHTTHSYPEIGRRFGGRDHTTILYAFHKIENLVASDPVFASQIGEIIGELPA
jgi:hypothetical protein